MLPSTTDLSPTSVLYKRHGIGHQVCYMVTYQPSWNDLHGYGPAPTCKTIQICQAHQGCHINGLHSVILVVQVCSWVFVLLECSLGAKG